MPTRRQILSTLAALPLAAQTPTPQKPKALRKGQTIGIVAPSSALWESDLATIATEVTQSLGFAPRLGQHVRDTQGDLAGEDPARADDLNRFFADPKIDAIFAVRGGYGAQRILPYLDYDVIRRNPKPLIGFSDITALHSAIHTQTGLVTFHGPNLLSRFNPYTYEAFAKVLIRPTPPTRVAEPPRFSPSAPGDIDRDNRLTTIVPGAARGPLIGGNLTVLSGLMGTPYQPDFDGRILFLEDVQEAPYRIDRMLTQLWLAGVFDQVAGVALGKFTEALPGRGRARSLEEIFHQRFNSDGPPVLRGLMIGHITHQSTIPIGAAAELDADAGTLTLLEAAVSA